MSVKPLTCGNNIVFCHAFERNSQCTINNICRKWRSGAQNNSTVGQEPNPCRMEPPPWPAVSTTQPQAPAPAKGETNYNKTTTERHSVEANQNRLKLNNSNNNIIIIIIMKTQ